MLCNHPLSSTSLAWEKVLFGFGFSLDTHKHTHTRHTRHMKKWKRRDAPPQWRKECAVVPSRRVQFGHTQTHTHDTQGTCVRQSSVTGGPMCAPLISLCDVINTTTTSVTQHCLACPPPKEQIIYKGNLFACKQVSFVCKTQNTQLLCVQIECVPLP